MNRLFIVILSFILFGIIVSCLNKNINEIKEPFTYDYKDLSALNNCIVNDITPHSGASAPIIGSCIDSYGPNGTISPNDYDKMERCVDKPIPQIGTTASTHNADMNTNLGALINNRSAKLKNLAQCDCSATQ